MIAAAFIASKHVYEHNIEKPKEPSSFAPSVQSTADYRRDSYK